MLGRAPHIVTFDRCGGCLTFQHFLVLTNRGVGGIFFLHKGVLYCAQFFRIFFFGYSGFYFSSNIFALFPFLVQFHSLLLPFFSGTAWETFGGQKAGCREGNASWLHAQESSVPHCHDHINT